MKKIAAFIVVILLAAAAGAGWKRFPKASEVQYETAVAQTGDIQATVAAVGSLQPLHGVDVGAQVSGQILKLHAQAGDAVEKGQLLVEIDASVHQANVDAGRAALEKLRAQLAEEEAQLTLAEQQLSRLDELWAGGLAPKEDWQVAQAARAATDARRRQRAAEILERQSTLKGEEALLGYTRIYAPMAGTIVSLDAREGQTINATYETPTILRIADLKVMTVWTAVAEADVQRVKPGMDASFTTLGNDERRWRGKVRQVLPMRPTPPGQKEPPPQANSVIQYTALFEVENGDGVLLPRMTAQVEIVTDSAKGVLVAPLAGLAPSGKEQGLFEARILGDDGQPQTRTVRTGKRDRRAAEALEGLKPGDRIIIGERPADKTRRFVW